MPIARWLLLATMVWPLAGPAVGRSPHPTVIKAEPKAYDTTGAVPSRLRLWFSEKISLSETRIGLRGPDKRVVRLSPPRVDPEPGDPVVVDILGALKPGVYRVSWRTVGEEGLETDGFYDFTLAFPRPAGGGQ